MSTIADISHTNYILNATAPFAKNGALYYEKAIYRPWLSVQPFITSCRYLIVSHLLYTVQTIASLIIAPLALLGYIFSGFSNNDYKELAFWHSMGIVLCPISIVSQTLGFLYKKLSE